MNYSIEPPRAWLITEVNTSTLAIITGRDESIFKNNEGWVVVDDLRTYPRFKILPRHAFNADYPELAPQIMVDEQDEKIRKDWKEHIG